MEMFNKGYIILFCPRCGKEQGNARMLDARGKLYDEPTDVQLDISKYEGHLVDALVAVREGGVNCDFTKIRIEDALENMADLLAEVKRLRKELEWFKQAINITADHIPQRAHWDAYVAEMVEKGLWPDEPED